MADNYPVDLTQPVPGRKAAYSTIKMALRIRWNLTAEYKPIFDLEGDARWWHAPIWIKAKKLGISTEKYREALQKFKGMPVVRLGILLLRVENDFLMNWWVNIKKAEKLAQQIAKDGVKTYEAASGKLTVVDHRAEGIKALLDVEREKMMGIKRLVETGRMLDPEQYLKQKRKKPPKEPEFNPGKTGVVEID